MLLTNPPIGNAAVKSLYQPVALTEIEVPISTGPIKFSCHVKAAPNIKAFFDIAHARGLSHLIKTFDGCYNPRPKRLSNQPSMHSYACAFDINAATNEQGSHGDMPQVLVDILKSLGFFWGGDFRGQYRDAMHAQLGTDFPLDGRAEPRITYSGEPAAAPAPPAPVLPPVDPFRTVKLFDVADGHLIGSAAGSGLIFADGHAYVRATALPAVLGDATLTAAVESGVIILRRGVKPAAV